MRQERAPKPLSTAGLRWSRGLVGVATFFLLLGAMLILGAGEAKLLLGVLVAGLGFTVLSIAGYYWGCENSQCS